MGGPNSLQVPSVYDLSSWAVQKKKFRVEPGQIGDDRLGPGMDCDVIDKDGPLEHSLFSCVMRWTRIQGVYFFCN
jgi:hypothetical protein